MRLAILVVCLVLLLAGRSVAQSAVLHVPSETSPPSDECTASGEEGLVLCAAAREKDLSIAQVIAEDDTAREKAQPPSAETAQDVWTAAYDQWVSGKARPKSPAVDRAVREARKRLGGDAGGHDPPESDALPDAEDDELVLVTRAVETLANGHADRDAVADAVRMIDALCPSGDNGRQVAAVGGMAHLLRLAGEGGDELSVAAVKAVASCAQNNAPVVERAVADGAVGTLLACVAGADASVAMRAGALRALVAVAEHVDARGKLAERREDVLRVVGDAVAMGEHGREERRCVVRGFALAETVLRGDSTWRKTLAEYVVEAAERALNSGDVDVREGAARVLTMLR